MADNDPDWEQNFALIELLQPSGHNPMLPRKERAGGYARMMTRSTVYAR